MGLGGLKDETAFLALDKIATGRVRTNPFPRNKPPETELNLSQRQHHGQKLQADLNGLRTLQPQFLESASPQKEISAPMPFLIRADPSLQQRDQLKSCGLEVVTTLHDNYAVVASENLNQLQDKITLYLDESRGGNKVAGIWEILDGRDRLRHILSSNLLDQWDKLCDEQPYTIDVGVACLGVQTQMPSPPQTQAQEVDERYLRRFDRWQKQCERQRWQWQTVREQRLEGLRQFIQRFDGHITSLVEGKITIAADLADSFTVRIALTGAGLRELALNYPYIFEIKEVSRTGGAVHDSEVTGVDSGLAIASPPFAPNVLQAMTQGKRQQLYWLRGVGRTAANNSWHSSKCWGGGGRSANVGSRPIVCDGSDG